MIAEDLDVLFADFGVTASLGSLTAQVILDRPDDAILGGMQISTDYAITFQAAQLPAIKHGDPITVDGTPYTVREVTLLDDGRLGKAALKR